MRRNWKRILSLLLTVAMVFTMNTSVFADTVTENAGEEQKVAVETTTPATQPETPAAESSSPDGDKQTQQQGEGEGNTSTSTPAESGATGETSVGTSTGEKKDDTTSTTPAATDASSSTGSTGTSTEGNTTTGTSTEENAAGTATTPDATTEGTTNSDTETEDVDDGGDVQDIDDEVLEIAGDYGAEYNTYKDYFTLVAGGKEIQKDDLGYVAFNKDTGVIEIISGNITYDISINKAPDVDTKYYTIKNASANAVAVSVNLSYKSGVAKSNWFQKIVVDKVEKAADITISANGAEDEYLLKEDSKSCASVNRGEKKSYGSGTFYLTKASELSDDDEDVLLDAVAETGNKIKKTDDKFGGLLSGNFSGDSEYTIEEANLGKKVVGSIKTSNGWEARTFTVSQGNIGDAKIKKASVTATKDSLKFKVEGLSKNATYKVTLSSNEDKWLKVNGEQVFEDAVAGEDGTADVEFTGLTSSREYNAYVVKYTKAVDKGTVWFGVDYTTGDYNNESTYYKLIKADEGGMSTLGNTYSPLTSASADIAVSSNEPSVNVKLLSNNSAATKKIYDTNHIAAFLVSGNGYETSANEIRKNMTSGGHYVQIVSDNGITAFKKYLSTKTGDWEDVATGGTYYVYGAYADNGTITDGDNLVSDIYPLGDITIDELKDSTAVFELLGLNGKSFDGKYEYKDQISTNILSKVKSSDESELPKKAIEVYVISKNLVTVSAAEANTISSGDLAKFNSNAKTLSQNDGKFTPSENGANKDYYVVVSVNGLNAGKYKSTYYALIVGTITITPRKLTVVPSFKKTEFKVGKAENWDSEVVDYMAYGKAYEANPEENDWDKGYIIDKTPRYIFTETDNTVKELTGSASFNEALTYSVFISEDSIKGAKVTGEEAYYDVSDYSETGEKYAQKVNVYDVDASSLKFSPAEGEITYSYYLAGIENEVNAKYETSKLIGLLNGDEDVTDTSAAELTYRKAESKNPFYTNFPEDLKPGDKIEVSGNFLGEYAETTAILTLAKQPIRIHGIEELTSYKGEAAKTTYDKKFRVFAISYNGQEDSKISVGNGLDGEVDVATLTASTSANITYTIDTSKAASYNGLVTMEFPKGLRSDILTYYELVAAAEKPVILDVYKVLPRSIVKFIDGENGSEIAIKSGNAYIDDGHDNLEVTLDTSVSYNKWYIKVNALDTEDITSNVTYDKDKKKFTATTGDTYGKKALLKWTRGSYEDYDDYDFTYDITFIASTAETVKVGAAEIEPIMPVVYDGNKHVAKGEKSGTADLINSTSEKDIVITYNGNPLKKGVDYKLSYKNNTNVGYATDGKKAPTVIVKGTKDYKDLKAELTFSILPQDFASAQIDVGNKYYKASKSGIKIKATVYDPVTKKKINAKNYEIHYIDSVTGEDYDTKPTTLNDGQMHIINVVAKSKAAGTKGLNYTPETTTTDFEQIVVYPSTKSGKFTVKLKNKAIQYSASKKSVSAGDFGAVVTVNKSAADAKDYTVKLYNTKSLMEDWPKGISALADEPTDQTGTYYLAIEPKVVDKNVPSIAVYQPTIVKVDFKGEKLKKTEFEFVNAEKGKFTVSVGGVTPKVSTAVAQSDFTFAIIDRNKDRYNNVNAPYDSAKKIFTINYYTDSENQDNYFVEPGKYILEITGRGSRSGVLKMNINIQQAQIKSLGKLSVYVNTAGDTKSNEAIYIAGSTDTSSSYGDGVSDGLKVKIFDSKNKDLSNLIDYDKTKFSVKGVGDKAGKVTVYLYGYSGFQTATFKVTATDFNKYFTSNATTPGAIKALAASTVSGTNVKANVKLMQLGYDGRWHYLKSGSDYKYGKITAVNTSEQEVEIIPDGKKYTNSGTTKKVKYGVYKAKPNYTFSKYTLSDNNSQDKLTSEWRLAKQSTDSNGNPVADSFVYDKDNAVCPKAIGVTVEIDGKTYTLNENQYTVVYENNTKVGKNAAAYLMIIDESYSKYLPTFEKLTTTKHTFTITN